MSVRTKHSEVCTKKTEGRYYFQGAPKQIKSGKLTMFNKRHDHKSDWEPTRLIIPSDVEKKTGGKDMTQIWKEKKRNLSCNFSH